MTMMAGQLIRWSSTAVSVSAGLRSDELGLELPRRLFEDGQEAGQVIGRGAHHPADVEGVAGDARRVDDRHREGAETLLRLFRGQGVAVLLHLVEDAAQ